MTDRERERLDGARVARLATVRPDGRPHLVPITFAFAAPDLVVTAVVNVGAEVIADGSIHVYAPLRGRAAAGARGDGSARIFTTRMEPQLVSIAGIYRTTEVALPAEVLGRAAQVRLDGDRLVIEPLGS